ncbi:MAG: hypothetical protein J1F40_08070, partial [Prevotellaceae bacterium]|nr:hypothetical protein [Prevotellaceae bacterium]
SSNGNYIWNIEETEIPAPAPEVYTVNVAEIKNGTVTADVAEAQAGETVTLTVTPAEGYELETLTVISVADNTVIDVSADYTFTMPEADVMVSATFVSSVQDGIDAADADAAMETERYTISGKRIATSQRGINVVKMSDGTVKKVLMR